MNGELSGSPQAPELSARLRYARKSRELTQLQVAERLGVSRTTVVAMENGQRKVQADELIKLSALYGLPVSYFMRPQPASESLASQLEAVLGGVFEDELVERFCKVCDDFLYLERLAGSRVVPDVPEYDTKGLSPQEAGELVASLERARLGLGESPVADLMELLVVEVGVRVVRLRMPSHISAIYAHTQVHGGCIAVNSALPLERARLYMAEGYGRYLLNRLEAGVTRNDRHDKGDRGAGSATAFLARSFLMPRAGVERYSFAVQRRRGQDVTPVGIALIAGYFGVSADMAALRLAEIGKIHSGAFGGLRLGNQEVREDPAPYAGSPVNELVEFPAKYIMMAIQGFAEGLLSEGQLADLLHQDRLSVRGTVEHFLLKTGAKDLDSLIRPV